MSSTSGKFNFLDYVTVEKIASVDKMVKYFILVCVMFIFINNEEI